MAIDKTINQKLAEMSEILADGYKWLAIRETLEQWSSEVDDPNSQELISLFDKSYRLFSALNQRIENS